NIAYPSGICAERTALFYAGATFPDVPVKAMAVAACGDDGLREEFVSPCGACRQVMSEVIRRYGQDFDVLMLGKKETVVIKASALLPFAFEYSL
ncbi:MAG: cytidine deaminase, partial [Odoribacter sp.]|nr:cytidine deaminase [Odoribacter sp.]